VIALWLTLSAMAGGHYHPDAIAGASQAFARASEAAPLYEEAESASRGVALGLQTYEENLDLLGDRAPAAERERMENIRQSFGREQAALAEFAGRLMEDFDMVFTQAMERAVAAHPDAQMCEATIRKAALPGMPAKEEANPDCTGEDLNGTIAAAMDADEALSGQIDELLGREWPTITVPDDPQNPIGSELWVTVDRFFGKAAKPSLRAIRDRDEAARLPIAAALEEGADPKSQLEEAQKITAETAAARASLAAPVFAAADKFSAKRAKKGHGPIGWCANPVELGGCKGENASGDLTDLLLGDKKVSKALP
jgi:hypothetical protein